MPLIVAFAGIANPNWVALSASELLSILTDAYELSFAFMRVGFVQASPTPPPVAPVPAKSGPMVPGVEAPHAAGDVSEPLPPWQMVTPVVGTCGFTIIVLLADAVPQEPPLVVSVKVAVPLNAAGGVHVAFRFVALGVKVPPAGVDHIPPVAPPPIEPLKGAEVPPWQMADTGGPASTVGAAFTIIVLLSKAVPQEPPVVVNVSVAVPLNPAGGVHVAVNVVASGLKVPPAGVDHIPPVATPPTEPFNAPEVPPSQIAGKAGPAFAVGFGFTVIVAGVEFAEAQTPLCTTALNKVV